MFIVSLTKNPSQKRNDGHECKHEVKKVLTLTKYGGKSNKDIQFI